MFLFETFAVVSVAAWCIWFRITSTWQIAGSIWDNTHPPAKVLASSETHTNLDLKEIL